MVWEENSLRFVVCTFILKSIIDDWLLAWLQWRIQEGGGAQEARPPIFGKYFKTSPKLSKIYKKILGATPQIPGHPLFLALGPYTILHI